jgi:hypothetical protein
MPIRRIAPREAAACAGMHRNAHELEPKWRGWLLAVNDVVPAAQLRRGLNA